MAREVAIIEEERTRLQEKSSFLSQYYELLQRLRMAREGVQENAVCFTLIDMAGLEKVFMLEKTMKEAGKTDVDLS